MQSQSTSSEQHQTTTRPDTKMELSLLHVLEREQVLEVLHRDEQLRAIEEDRIRRLKQDLQEIRRKGAKSSGRQYDERTCARCQRPLGKLWNRGAVCYGCSHRTCSKCCVSVTTIDWKCTVCFAHRDVKFRTGEWFLEEKSKKFPTTGKNESVGERLLKTYGVLSHIAIVPPTPPHNHLDFAFLSKSGNLKNSKPLRSSMEDLMLSVTNNIKKKSTSENDVRHDHLKVQNSKKSFHLSVQKSLSDTDISKSLKLFKVPSLPNVFKKSRESDPESWSTGAEDDASLTSGSCGSVSTDCGVVDAPTTAGELELAVAYNNTTSSLEISVGACQNLTCGDTKKKKCNAYVQVYIRPEKHAKLKTTVKKNTTNPVYREVLKHHIERSLLTGKHLQACVFNSGSLRRKVFLGEALIPLDRWISEKPMESFHWYPLCAKQAEWTEGGAWDTAGTSRGQSQGV